MRQPANVETTLAEVQSLRRDQTELLALVRELRTRMEAQSEGVAALRADSNVQLRQLEERIQMLTAQLEEQGVRSQRHPRNDYAPRPVPGADSLSARPQSSLPTTSPAALFEAAQRDYNRGNYPLALVGFEDYLKAAPESDLADDAQYWKGQTYFSQGDMQRATQEFLKVRDLYPDGDRVALATLQIGNAFLRQSDSATARRYFETVIREYPGSDEAALAKDKVAGLN
jgi:tol-pal system protein YbgF